MLEGTKGPPYGPEELKSSGAMTAVTKSAPGATPVQTSPRVSLGVVRVKIGLFIVAEEVPIVGVGELIVMVGVPTTAADVPIIPPGQPRIFPSESSFSTQISLPPAPKESVDPATIYPPSMVCWMELAISLSDPP